MKKSSKIIITSILTILACVSLIAGATFALFTSESKTNIAVTSATVDLEATIGDITMKSTVGDGTPMGSYTHPVGTNELTIERFTPGDYVEFNIDIANKSDIPVKWQLQISTDAESDEDKAFYKQLDIAVSGAVSADDLVNTGKASMSKWQPLEAGKSPDPLGVKVAFPAAATQQTGGTVKLVVNVLAVQGNATTTDPVAEEVVDPNSVYIYSLEEFKAFAQEVKGGDNYNGKTVYLMENLDLAGSEWEPIGAFDGTFDGNNLSISNLYVNKPDQDNVGLFSTGAMTIKNLVLHNADVKGHGGVGAVAGENSYITVDNVSVTGLIRIEGNYKVGGILGGTYNPITNCTVEGITGSYIKGVYSAEKFEGDNVGGIIGFTGELHSITEDNISNCHVSGVTVSGTRKVGGVVGYLHHGQGVSHSSFSNGTVAGTAEPEYVQSQGIDMIAIGGIVGQTHDANAAQSIKDNKVSNITINVPDTYTFATVTAGQKLTSAILGGARECDTSGGIAHAKTILASGNTTEKVTVNAKLKDVEYGRYNDAYISAVTVENVADVLSLREMQFDESNPLNHKMDVIGENRTTVTFVAGDYDFEGIDWKPLSGWRYNYEGNGSTIRNLNMQTAQWRGGFVDSAQNCKISQFTFDSAIIKGEQAAVVCGHIEQGQLDRVTIKGNILVDYEIPVEHQRVGYPTQLNNSGEKYPGIGVFVGAIADAGNNGVRLTIDKDSTILIDTAHLSDNIGKTGGVSYLKSITDDFLFGYVYGGEAGASEFAVTTNGVHVYEVRDGFNTRIYTEADLIALREVVSSSDNMKVGEGATIYLMNDIALSEPWTPIGDGQKEFVGTFDGQGYEISNFFCNGTGQMIDGHFGLFYNENVPNTVKNLKISGNIDLTLNDEELVLYLGVINCGTQGSKLENVWTDVDVNIEGVCSALTFGGLAYSAAKSQYCISSGDIQINVNAQLLLVGGLFAFGMSTTVDYCVFTGTLNLEEVEMQVDKLIAYGNLNSFTHCYSDLDKETFDSEFDESTWEWDEVESRPVWEKQ